MNNIPKLSIIIPIYNAEQFIRRCIDSILVQTYTDFELLLIDDGSKDNSGNICDIYAEQDSRIRVFHKNNGGVSSARNLGLDKARGEWIVFVDSDDAISNHYLSIVKDFISDLILTGCDYPDVKFIEDETGITGEDLLLFYERFLHTLQMRVPWAKFFKRSLIGNLRFNESYKIGEDTLFILTYLKKVKIMSITNKASYIYTPNTDFVYSKYALDAEVAAKTCGDIFKAYLSLGVRNYSFEKFIYNFFFELCRNNTSLSHWYFNANIFKLHLFVSDNYDWRYRLSYLKKGFLSLVKY